MSRSRGSTSSHVLQELSPVEPGELWDTVDNESRAEHATKALREQLSQHQMPDLSIHILFGDPGHGIAHFAEKHNADLIVFGDEPGDLAGHAATLLDLDGDGRSELWLGVPGNDMGGPDAGAIAVLAWAP